MSDPALRIGNFEFEHELAEPARGSGALSSASLRRNAELSAHLVALAAEGDTLLLPAPLPAGFLDHLSHAGLPEFNVAGELSASLLRERSVEPWGWSAGLVSRLHRLGWDGPIPNLAAIRAGNSRRFSAALESELDCALPTAGIVTSFEELGARIRAVEREFPDPVQVTMPATVEPPFEPRPPQWLLKAEFGMSGRERLAGRGIDLPPASRAWIERRLTQQGVLFFEPWVPCLAEFSTQWELTDSADGRRSQLKGITQLLSDRRGQYLGNRPLATATSSVLSLESFLKEPMGQDQHKSFDAMLRACQTAVTRLAEAGVTGPVGIDSMVYRSAEGRAVLRPLQDINVRWTMGRLACELHRHLAAEHSCWLHMPASGIDAVEARARASGCLTLRTSPSMLGGQATARIALLIQTDDPTDLEPLCSSD